MDVSLLVGMRRSELSERAQVPAASLKCFALPVLWVLVSSGGSEGGGKQHQTAIQAVELVKVRTCFFHFVAVHPTKLTLYFCPGSLRGMWALPAESNGPEVVGGFEVNTSLSPAGGSEVDTLLLPAGGSEVDTSLPPAGGSEVNTSPSPALPAESDGLG